MQADKQSSGNTNLPKKCYLRIVTAGYSVNLADLASRWFFFLFEKKRKLVLVPGFGHTNARCSAMDGRIDALLGSKLTTTCPAGHRFSPHRLKPELKLKL